MQCEPTVRKKKLRAAQIVKDNTTHNLPCWLRGKHVLWCSLLCIGVGQRYSSTLEKGAGDSKWSWQSEDPGNRGAWRCKNGADPSALQDLQMDEGVGRDKPGVRDLLKVDKSRGQPSVSSTVNKLLAEGLKGSNQECFHGNSFPIAMLNWPSIFWGLPHREKPVLEHHTSVFSLTTGKVADIRVFAL